MDPAVKEAIFRATRSEPLVLTLGMELLELEAGHSLVAMVYKPERHDNLFARAHGGALFALIDEAFETAAQTSGQICVALNVNVSYHASPKAGDRLLADARLGHDGKTTSSYRIEVHSPDGKLLASCQALAYNTGKPLPFL